MNLVLRFLANISGAIASELQQLVVRLNTWAAKEHNADGTHNEISVNALALNDTTQTTVGAAGGASALPATPTGYQTVTIDGTEYVFPFYAKS